MVFAKLLHYTVYSIQYTIHERVSSFVDVTEATVLILQNNAYLRSSVLRKVCMLLPTCMFTTG